MKIEKYEKIGSAKYRLYLDNGEIIDTYDEVILKNELLIKKELSPEMYQKVFLETEIQEHYHACVKYISFRIRSVKEIRDYLKKRNVSLEDIEIIIEKLKHDQLLDDAYFTECFIKDKLKFTTMGRYRILQELKRYEIDASIIALYFDLLNDEVMREKIITLIEKKIKSNRKKDIGKVRNQLYHSLLNLGYPSSLIVEELNKYFNYNTYEVFS